jgi:hypothetical protein
VILQIKFDGTDPNADNILANGIEQCIFNPKDGNFYINIPNSGAATLATALPGLALRISGKAPVHVEKIVAEFCAEEGQQCIDAGGNGGGLQQGNRCFRQRGE